MSMNEFHNSSSLSTKEQNEAMASIYTNPQAAGNVNVTLTPEQYRVLQLLQAQAGNLMDQPVREFDLNKPPAEPYRYQEFPFVMYHHALRQAKAVRTEEEREILSTQGWSVTPFPAEVVEIKMEDADRAEAADMDRRLKAQKGRS